MTALTYFTVTGTYLAAVRDSVLDVDTDPELLPLWGTVTFTPLISAGDSIPAATLTPPANLFLAPIKAQIRDGVIWRNGVAGVKLVANTAVLGLDGDLFYQVNFGGGLTAGGRTYTASAFDFTAPTTAVTLDLLTVTPEPGFSAVGGTSAMQVVLFGSGWPASRPSGLSIVAVGGSVPPSWLTTSDLWFHNDTDAVSSSAGTGAFAGVLTHLSHNRSTVIQALGDSTVYGTVPAGGWLGALGLGLGQQFDANVWQCFWNDTNQAYDPPVVLNTSTLGARTASAVGAQYAGATPTGDVEIIACISPVTWPPTTYQSVVSKWNVSAGFGMFLPPGSGVLQLLASSDGVGGNARAFTSTAVMPFTQGQTWWVRLTFRLNNGSGGSTVTFYTSPDGTTWTQLGSPVIQSGTTPIFNNPADPYQIGQQSPGPLNPLTGTISWIQIRNALANGVDVVPCLPEQWDSPGTVSGGPLILLMNGGHPGANLAYLDDSTRRTKMLTALYPDAIFTADGFNEGSAASAFAGLYLAWVNHIKTARPNVPIIVTTQNPWVAPKTAAQFAPIAEYASRVATTMAAQPGVTVLDTALAYEGNTAAYIGSDGEHPTLAGYQAQGAWMLQHLGVPTVA